MPEPRKTRPVRRTGERESRRTADKARRDEQYDEGSDDAYDEGSDDAYDEGYDAEPRDGRAPSSDLSAAQAARAGIRQIAELTGKNASGVVSVEPADNGWLVGVEVVEERRVPSTADVLGLYEAAIDTGGALVSYRRTRRYARGRGNGNGNGGGAG